MASQNILQSLLCDYPAPQFLEEFYLRLPYSGSGGVLSSLDPIEPDSLIADAFKAQNLDLIVGREGAIRDKLAAATPAEIRGFLSEGQTLGLRHLQRTNVAVTAWADQFSTELGGPVDVHLYWTPAGHRGFGWHYDAEEVFVLQLRGAKIWRLRKNTVNPWPLMEAIPADQQYEREIMPVQRQDLTSGSWLYVPSGYWHATEADQESVSLSIGIRAPVALDILDFIKASFREAIEWRERLPCTGCVGSRSAIELESRYAEMVDRLIASFGSHLKNPQVLGAIVRHFHPHHSASAHDPEG